MTKKILVISSDHTGHGHKSIAESLQEQCGLQDGMEIEIVDGFTLGGKLLLNVGKSYGPITRYSTGLWNVIWHLSALNSILVDKFFEMMIRKNFLKVLEKVKPDLILSIHPNFNGSVIQILRKENIPIPFGTLIADLVNIYPLWADERADFILSPTEEAKTKCLQFGVPAERIKVVGFPVRARFQRHSEKQKSGNSLHGQSRKAEVTSLHLQHDQDQSLHLQHDQDQSLHFQHDQDQPLHFQHDQDQPLHFQHDQDQSLHFQHDQEQSLHFQHDQDQSLHFQHDQDQSLHFQHDQDQPLHFLMMSGGEGVGNMNHIAENLLQSFDCTVSIIAGRNEKLKRKLEASLQSRFGDRAQIYGFVKNIQDLMLAADIMISRGSPNVIFEAVAVNLPVVVTGALPGQEKDNPRFVENHQLGVFCKNSKELPALIEGLLANNREQLRAITESQRLYLKKRAAAEILNYLLSVEKENLPFAKKKRFLYPAVLASHYREKKLSEK